MKRILSFILSVCMIISLVPVISAIAEDEAAYQLVYDLKNVDEFENKGQMNTDNVKFTTTDGTFEYHSTNSKKVTYRKSYIEIQEGDGVYFAVKINVPYSGTFSAKMTYYQYDNTSDNTNAENTEGDVYLLKSTVADVGAATAEDKVADIATAVAYGKPDSTGAGVKETTAKDITLSAGEYILVFEQTQRRGGSSGQRMRPSVVTLTSGTLADGESYATVPMYISEALANDTELEVGESTDITVSGWMNDGTTFDETSENVTFSSESGNISIDGNTVTANSAGAAIVTASVTSGGKTISEDIAITVARPAGQTPYQLEYHFTQVDEFRNVDKYCYQDVGNSYMIPDNATFSGTYGMWAFYRQKGISNWGENNSKAFQYRPSYSEIRTMKAGDYFAVKINVPYSGTYNARYSHCAREQDYILKVSMYILDGNSTLENVADDIANKKIATIANGLICSGPELTTGVTAEEPVEIENLPAGEHILIFYVDECEATSGSATRIRPASLTLTSGELATGEEYAKVPMCITAADAELEVGESTSLTASGWFNDRTSFDETSVTFSSESENISIDGNTVTANSVGTAVVTASVTSGEKTLTEDAVVTVISADTKQITDAFTVASAETGYNVTAAATVYVKGEDNHGIVASATRNGDMYEMKAPVKEGYTFLYWTKALETNKKIVSLAPEFNYKPAANESNILIAVYKKAEVSETTGTAEFYNANGQLLYTTAEDAIDENNVTVENGILTIPALPSMAGYSAATHWQLYGDEEEVKYGASVDTVELSGTMIFVASYPETPTKMVEVNGKSVAYGTQVTFTSDASQGAFKWWIKKVNGVDEIVSIEDTYSFLAWEDCTVTGVYGEEKPVYTGEKLKIIIDAFGADGIMAEFIGFENVSVVEKGIMYNNKNIPMTTDKPQFTVTADKSGIFKGYAIVKDGKGYALITDGEATITIEE